MPLFNRPDGTPLKNVSLVRRIMPFLMPTRNEAFILYDDVIEAGKALAFVERWNAEHAEKITIFHVLLASFARGLVTRPGLDRFVSGGRIYQRKESHISFVVKKAFKDEAPMLTVKLKLIHGEPFGEFVHRIHELVHGSRDETEKPVEKELRLVFMLPAFLLNFFVWLVRRLDALNLVPGWYMKNDPMYASIFVANLGSVGIDRVYHHMYEYGTVSLFGAIGVVRKMVFVGPNDEPVVKPGVSVRWNFDERINDGHYCFESLAIARRHVEDPELLLEPWPPIQSAESHRRSVSHAAPNDRDSAA